MVGEAKIICYLSIDGAIPLPGRGQGPQGGDRGQTAGRGQAAAPTMVRASHADPWDRDRGAGTSRRPYYGTGFAR